VNSGAPPGCCSRAGRPTLDATDDGYKATPAGWADHFGYKDIEAFLFGDAMDDKNLRHGQADVGLDLPHKPTPRRRNAKRAPHQDGSLVSAWPRCVHGHRDPLGIVPRNNDGPIA
jgi:hypothetical protein